MKRIFCVLIATVLLVYCVGCDTYATVNYYPYDRATHWYCEEIDFEFIYTENEYGNLSPVLCPLVWDGETYMVYTNLFAGYFDLELDNGDGMTTQDEMIVQGEWYYQGDALVVEINKETVFDGAFEELVFVPKS